MHMPREKIIGFRVTAVTAYRLRRAAARDERRVSAFVRRLIERALADEESGEEPARPIPRSEAK